MDNELFELCKDVYEKTNWESEDSKWFIQGDDDKEPWLGNHQSTIVGYVDISPLYTSDYLLEKLRSGGTIVSVTARYNDESWCAFHLDEIDCYADTPLKALLKLTIELHKQGLLEK